MKKVAGLVVVVIVVLGIAGCAGLRALGSSAAPHAKAAVLAKVPTTTKTYSMEAGGLKRSYEVIAPVRGLPKSAPVIVMLSGIGATVASEMSRDDVLPYASYDEAEIVYPVAVGQSWNAIGCCGKAATEKVDDVGFMKALVAALDPGHARPIDVVGYSNGARLAYRIACDDPGLFDAYAMVKGGPTQGCSITKPVSIEQLASLDDPEMPYKPGDHNDNRMPETPVTTLMSQLHTAEKCPAKSAAAHSGTMTLTTWSACGDGARLALATWQDGVHSFPRPPASVPAAAQVFWAFFTKTPLAPIP